MWFIVGAIVGIIIGAIIAALIMSAAESHADAVMFRTLRTYDFETKTRYALVPEVVERPKPNLVVLKAKENEHV